MDPHRAPDTEDWFGSFGFSREEALSVLDPILDKAIEAHASGRYEDYRRVITQSLAEKVSEEGFSKAHREVWPTLGTLISRRFLGALKKQNNPMLLFSARFENTINDVLITVVFENSSNPPLIDWLWIE